MGPAAGLLQMEGMAEVADRVNSQLFQQAPHGAAVRIAGRLDAVVGGPGSTLTATDGGVISLTTESEDIGGISGFAEVVGTKVGNSSLQATGALPLGNVDAEMWDEAVRMAHLPQ